MSTKTKGGKAFIIVGATGMGKTTWIKNAIKRVHPDSLFLYDVNNEYIDYYNQPLIDFDQFSKQSTGRTDSLIVYEESTIFLNNRGSNSDLINVLVRKRHTRNTIFLVFHSLRAVPKYIIDLCNYLVLYKTFDPMDVVKKFDRNSIIEAYTEIQKAPMLTAENGREYSPSKIIELI